MLGLEALAVQINLFVASITVASLNLYAFFLILLSCYGTVTVGPTSLLQVVGITGIEW